VKGDRSSKDKVRAELKKANFKATARPASSLQHPQTFRSRTYTYRRNALRIRRALMTVKTIATAVKDDPRIPTTRSVL